MLSEVQEDVGHGPPDLARGPELACVIAVTPDGAMAVSGAVNGECAADDQSLQTTSQRPGIIPFNNQMDVVGLNGKMNYAESSPIGCAEGPF